MGEKPIHMVKARQMSVNILRTIQYENLTPNDLNIAVNLLDDLLNAMWWGI